jgi:hypothetical protein
MLHINISSYRRLLLVGVYLVHTYISKSGVPGCLYYQAGSVIFGRVL